MSKETNESMPVTESLVNEDGVLDEKAAGAAIDKVLAEANNQLLEAEKEIQPVSEEAEDNASSEETSTAEDWVNDENIQEVMKSAGYSEEDIQGFSNAQDFQKHVELLDRQIKEGRLRAGEDLEKALEVDEQIQQDASQRQNINDLPQLDPEEFDERLINALTARDNLIAELVQKLDGTNQNNLLSNFDQFVDDLNMPDVFGHSSSPTDETTSQRDRLWKEYAEMYNNLEERGKPVQGKEVNQGIILRALNLEFADELQKANRRNLTMKAKKQAARITGSNTATSNVHYDGDVTKDPVLLAKYAELMKENG